MRHCLVRAISQSGNRAVSEAGYGRWSSSLSSLVVSVALVVGCDRQPKPAALDGASSQSAGRAPAASPRSGETEASRAGPAPEPVAAGERQARELLSELIEVYRGADSYADSGEISVAAVRDGQSQSFPAIPFSITFARPNRVRLHAFGAVAVCDGREFRAVINELPEQVLIAPAPLKLEYGDAFLDRALAESLRGAMEIELWPLALLTDGSRLSGMINEASRLELLEDAPIDVSVCRRVRLTTAAGTMTLWIDGQSKLLHRVEYPTDAIRARGGPSAPSKLEVTATMAGARLNSALPPEAFSLELPRSARLVRRFLPPPPELPPAILGQRLDGYEFDDLIGGKVNRVSLAGKIAVISFWATWSEASLSSLAALQSLYERYRDDDRVAFLAINVDADDVDDDQAAAALRAAKSSVPLARDRARHYETAFEVEGLPTAFLLARDGSVQDLQIGDEAVKSERLENRLERLLDGEDLVEAARRRYEQLAREYEEDNVDAIIGATTSISLPKAEIAPRSQPRRIAMHELWSVRDVRAPGNLLAVEADDGAARIFALEASRGVVEISAAGQVVARRPFNWPDDQAAGRLRTAVNAAGERLFAAFAVTQQQVRLFDRQWNALLTYPAAETQHSGLADVQLGDLDFDGHPELIIGYLGPTGVHAVSLTGERRWRERSVTNVLGLAAPASLDRAARGVWCVNGSDAVARLGVQGELEQTIRVGGGANFFVAELPKPTDGCQLVVMAQTETLNFQLIGIDSQGRAAWSYSLPTGLHESPVEPCVVATDWRASGETLFALASPDGAMHLVDSSGELVDAFATGAAIGGVACTRIDDQPALIVASRDAITAWQIRFADRDDESTGEHSP